MIAAAEASQPQHRPVMPWCAGGRGPSVFVQQHACYWKQEAGWSVVVLPMIVMMNIFQRMTMVLRSCLNSRRMTTTMMTPKQNKNMQKKKEKKKNKQQEQQDQQQQL